MEEMPGWLGFWHTVVRKEKVARMMMSYSILLIYKLVFPPKTASQRVLHLSIPSLRGLSVDSTWNSWPICVTTRAAFQTFQQQETRH